MSEAVNEKNEAKNEAAFTSNEELKTFRDVVILGGLFVIMPFIFLAYASGFALISEISIRAPQYMEQVYSISLTIIVLIAYLGGGYVLGRKIIHTYKTLFPVFMRKAKSLPQGGGYHKLHAYESLTSTLPYENSSSFDDSRHISGDDHFNDEHFRDLHDPFRYHLPQNLHHESYRSLYDSTHPSNRWD